MMRGAWCFTQSRVASKRSCTCAALSDSCAYNLASRSRSLNVASAFCKRHEDRMRSSAFVWHDPSCFLFSNRTRSTISLRALVMRSPDETDAAAPAVLVFFNVTCSHWSGTVVTTSAKVQLTKVVIQKSLHCMAVTQSKFQTVFGKLAVLHLVFFCKTFISNQIEKRLLLFK